MTATVLRPVGDPPAPPRHRRRRWLLIALALTALLAVATWLVAFSSVFGVRSVEVQGTHVLTAAAVEKAAAVPHGVPLARLDTAAITERVEALPQVESAEVATSFPSTVTVTVTERTAVGYVVVAGRAMLVDTEGVRYLGVDTLPARLPKLVAPASGGTAATRAVAQVAAAMPADLLARTRSIEALDPSAVTVVLRSDQLVQWGDATRNVAKARIVDVLRTRKHVDTIDVSDPDRPYTT